MIRALFLWWRMTHMPDVEWSDATAFWIAAEIHQSPIYDAELLAALGWAESRYQSSAQPRCGVLQVWPADLDLPAERCALWRSGTLEGVAAGVLELETIGSIKGIRTLRQVLMYRACGGSALRGGCDKGWWVDQAIERRRELARGLTDQS